jgi:hypothetical protein
VRQSYRYRLLGEALSHTLLHIALYGDEETVEKTRCFIAQIEDHTRDCPCFEPIKGYLPQIFVKWRQIREAELERHRSEIFIEYLRIKMGERDG